MEIMCFSHLRWNFVYQRPQHLLTRFRSKGQVHFWEEPRFEGSDEPRLAQTEAAGGIHILTPILRHGTSESEAVSAQRELLDAYVSKSVSREFLAWYYTPMALQFSDHLCPNTVVYDCMDELSGFQGASPRLLDLELQLFTRADIVFAGGASLYASKQDRHTNVHLFASSIDYGHFAAARERQPDPPDQERIPHPRIGFYGVLDERLDRELLRRVSGVHPEWHFVLIGPLAKINEEDLPHAANIHYLGQKEYAELPVYLANWDVAMLPFALNASTRFISPTKTPEYLAGGKPVVSTPIQDVVRLYGDMGLVKIGATAEEFADGIRKNLEPRPSQWLAEVDRFLAGTSWDRTFEGMWTQIVQVMRKGSADSRTSGAHHNIEVETNV